jgi:hypothetical protein
VVVCAVICEPVSDANSLLSGNLTGNFELFAFGEPDLARKTPLSQPLLAYFPIDWNREFETGHQGIPE